MKIAHVLLGSYGNEATMTFVRRIIETKPRAFLPVRISVSLYWSEKIETTYREIDVMIEEGVGFSSKTVGTIIDRTHSLYSYENKFVLESFNIQLIGTYIEGRYSFILSRSIREKDIEKDIRKRTEEYRRWLILNNLSYFICMS